MFAEPRRDDGAAVVDFVLVCLILVPLFVAVLQLGFALYVRNTLAACAQDGAREGASENFVVAGGAAMRAAAAERTRNCVDDWVSSGYSRDISVGLADSSDGVDVEVVKVRVASPVPVLGLFGLGSQAVHVSGEAMQERP